MRDLNTSAEKHPCFSLKEHGRYGRIHLPVAPKCNVQCRYCNRKYDCANESRPGVTSAVLTPAQAMQYLDNSLKINPQISVAAIAGPGDAFANPQETLETLTLLRQDYPHLIACLSTNGLNIKPYLRDIYDLGVRYLTITINGLDIQVVSKIYEWIRHEKKTYRGAQAAEILISNQMDALETAKSMGMTVKVNSVILPGINDAHLLEVAQTLSAFRIDRMNCIPVQKNENEFFDAVATPTEELINQVRDAVSAYVPVMTHCQRCRSDAAGFLGEDQNAYQEALRAIISERSETRTRCVAVASLEGLFVNAHLGEAQEFMIFQQNDSGFRFLENRKAPPRGLGDARWLSLAEILGDCTAVLVSGVGGNPRKILAEKGIQVYEVSGFIEDALNEWSKGLLNTRKSKTRGCSDHCTGSGMGCC